MAGIQLPVADSAVDPLTPAHPTSPGWIEVTSVRTGDICWVRLSVACTGTFVALDYSQVYAPIGEGPFWATLWEPDNDRRLMLPSTVPQLVIMELPASGIDEALRATLHGQIEEFFTYQAPDIVEVIWRTIEEMRTRSVVTLRRFWRFDEVVHFHRFCGTLACLAGGVYDPAEFAA